MLRNYFTIAWRNITRHKGYALMNVLGLALGLCSCMVIYLIAHYELSFDGFHPDKRRIDRVMTSYLENDGSWSQFGTVPYPGLLLLGSGLSGVDAVAGLEPYGPRISIPDGDKPAANFDSRPDGGGFPSVGIAQASWFSVFHYDRLAGTVSREPFTVVLTERRAHQYFGPGPVDGMLGKIVLYDSIPMHVSGIIKDWDQNTDLGFTDFISFSTLQSSPFRDQANRSSWNPDGERLLTFVKRSENTSSASIRAQMAALIKGRLSPDTRLSLGLDPLTDLHFNGKVIECPIRTAHMPTLYALMGIALFILLIAVINFINLSTAQFLQRTREIGVRKVLGGSRVSLIFQFLTETFLLTLMAIAMALLFVNPALTLFRSFLPPGLSFHLTDPSLLLFILVITVVTTLLAGFYPARVLASFLPALTLKGNGGQAGSGKWYLRKGLIVFQFTVSLVFITGSIVMATQMSYVRHKDLGFTSDAVLTIGTPWGDSLSKIKVAAQRMRQLSHVSRVALQWAGPGNTRGMSVRFDGTNGKEIRTAQVDGDENLIPLYRLKLVAGRNLSHADSVDEFVINENLSRIMGCKRPEDAIGKTIYWLGKPYPVVGVAADFHPGSLHDPIPPLCIINRVERERTLVVKLATRGHQSGTVKNVLAQLENVWKSVYPGGTFSYRFYDETLAMAYERDRQAGTLMNTAMLITIFISCIGLFGLSMFSAEKRTREIGVRKVLGASVESIVGLLSKDFIKLVAIAAIIATPLAWWIMSKWLQNFAYRIAISWWIFLSAGALALLIALITVSFHAIKAAVADPVKSLRTE